MQKVQKSTQWSSYQGLVKFDWGYGYVGVDDWAVAPGLGVHPSCLHGDFSSPSLFLLSFSNQVSFIYPKNK